MSDTALLDPPTNETDTTGESTPAPKGRAPRASKEEGGNGNGGGGFTLDMVRELVGSVVREIVPAAIAAAKPPKNEEPPMISAEDEHASMKRQLGAQEKVTVNVPVRQLGDKKSVNCTVQINGYTFTLRRGKNIPVPRSVYEILVQSGEIPAAFEEDEKYQPVETFRALDSEDPTTLISRQKPGAGAPVMTSAMV